MATPHQFTGSIPEHYDRYLVPVMFTPYAESMAARVADLKPKRVLELACGTGALTRCLVRALPAQTQIVATDFSPDMLEVAKMKLASGSSVNWRVADACDLPFEDESFDVIVCQFGVMMFPDKAVAMSEALRVLAPGGHLFTSAWGHLEDNSTFHTVETTLTAMFPDAGEPFVQVPISMPDPETHRQLAMNAGFSSVEAAMETHRTGPHNPTDFAFGYTQGSPLVAFLTSQGYDLETIQVTLTEACIANMGNPMYCELSAVVCHAVKG